MDADLHISPAKLDAALKAKEGAAAQNALLQKLTKRKRKRDKDLTAATQKAAGKENTELAELHADLQKLQEEELDTEAENAFRKDAQVDAPPSTNIAAFSAQAIQQVPELAQLDGVDLTDLPPSMVTMLVPDTDKAASLSQIRDHGVMMLFQQCASHLANRARLGDLPAAVSKALYQHATQSPSDLASAAVATLHGLAAAKHDIEAEAEGAGEETLAGAGLKRLWHSWAPSDNDLMQTLKQLGYRPPTTADGNVFDVDMDVEEGKAAGVDIAGEHPRLHHLHGLCHTIVHFASMHKERLEVEPLSVSKPPFGKNATVAAALACAAHDPSCAAAACDLQAALAAYVSMAKDREWGRALAPAAAAIVGALPHATAASEAPPIENLSALPADDFLAVLPSATSLLAQITPTNSGNHTGDAAVAGAVGAVPDAWAALASVRLVDAVAQPLLGAQAVAARAGSEPGSLLQTQVEALFAEMEARLKSRGSVAVFRMRLLAAGLQAFYEDARTRAVAVAQKFNTSVVVSLD